MSIWATTWAYEQTIKPATRKFILVSLANFADEKGFCYPSQRTLADMTDQGVSTVREHLKELEIEGLIRRTHRYSKKQGGGRTSDGFYLLAPAERLKPPVKSLPLKSSAKSLTAESQRTYRQDSADLPPKVGDDPLVEPSGEKSAHASLMEFHSNRIGKIPDGAAQGKAIKMILAAGHSPEKAIACYQDQITEPWRKGHVTWLTVWNRIGEFHQQNGNGHKPHDTAWHAKQAELARRAGREYRSS